jgi:hypothetical protein
VREKGRKRKESHKEQVEKLATVMIFTPLTILQGEE